MSDADYPLIARDLLAFQLFDWLGADDRVDRETSLSIIDMATKLALEYFLPHYRQGDTDEPYLDADGVHILPATREALAKFSELGLFGASFPEALGGMGLPMTLHLSLFAIMAAANSGTVGYTVLTAANARLICKFGEQAQIDTFALPQIEGRWFGTMCLSEPQAGSSLGDIRTAALPDGVDALGQRYRLRGNKMWISGGDQDASENIVHLVLAKIAQPDGTLPEGPHGISLFIVPKVLPDGTPNDIAVAGLNHKMGNRATSNCLLAIGEQAGAIGWRVGEPGLGLAQMFMMMNEARIAVGLSAAALAYRGYRHAARYARERLQGRVTGARGGEQEPIIVHADVRQMLLRQKIYAESGLALGFYSARLADLGDAESLQLLDLLTPVTKSWPSEFGLVANDLAIQVHGGYGYTRDFDVELLYRDNRLNRIHEGTTGVQALDLLRRKLLASDGSAFTLLTNRISKLADKSLAYPALAAHGRALTGYWDNLAVVIEGLRAIGAPHALDNATLFLNAFGHGVIAWLLLDQTLCAIDKQSSCIQALAAETDGFFAHDLVQARAWLEIVACEAQSGRAIAEDIFA
jgi:alkylation response protein AidB-like acyl-CoA dehydrogenase